MRTYEESFGEWFNHAQGGCCVCFRYSPRAIVRGNLCAVGKPLIKEWMKAADRQKKEGRPEGS